MFVDLADDGGGGKGWMLLLISLLRGIAWMALVKQDGPAVKAQISGSSPENPDHSAGCFAMKVALAGSSCGHFS